MDISPTAQYDNVVMSLRAELLLGAAIHIRVAKEKLCQSTLKFMDCHDLTSSNLAMTRILTMQGVGICDEFCGLCRKIVQG